MSSEEWRRIQNVDALIARAKKLKALPGRKARLFACGCFRVLWDRITDSQIRTAVEMAEGCADRLVSKHDLEQRRYLITNGDQFNQDLASAIMSLMIPNLSLGHIAWHIRCAIDPALYAGWEENRYSVSFEPQANLLREVIGDPYAPVAWDRSWRTSAAVAIASQMYESRDFGPMPVLADALQDAGCENADVLDHCRNPEGVHVRGCWVVDLVLGKK